MTVYVALLRAINLAGTNRVAMSDLQKLFAGLGYTNVRTLLQSGNVVFQAEATPPADLERLLETEAATQLNLRTDFLVRTADDLAAVVQRNPFPVEAQRDPGHLLVMFLKDAPGRAAVDALRAAIPGREQVQVQANHAYITYPDGIGRSRMTNTLIESKLRTRGTGRNWNTVLKLAALASA
jgi:uncharacterized protein (DUF1697 family)